VLRTNSELVGELNSKKPAPRTPSGRGQRSGSRRYKGKGERLLQDFVAASGSSLGLDGIERVGGRFRRWGLGSRHQRSGARFPGEIEK